MGWSFRKSIKCGPVRINLSKSGVGVSTGVKGARVSFGPKGTRVYGGYGPFRFQKQISGNTVAGDSSRSCGGCLAICLVCFVGLVFLGTLRTLKSQPTQSQPTQSQKRPDLIAQTQAIPPQPAEQQLTPRPEVSEGSLPVPDVPTPGFNVPVLLGKKITTIQAILKTTPTDYEAEKTCLGEKAVIFDKEGVSLIVNYDTSTGLASSFFIFGRNKQSLLKLAGVSLTGNYDLEFVQYDNSSHICGLKIYQLGYLHRASVGVERSP